MGTTDQPTYEKDVNENISIKSSGHREITDGLYFIKECIAQPPTEEGPLLDGWYKPGHEMHVSQNIYVFKDDRNLVFDTGTPLGEEVVLRELDAILGDEPLDYLVISHPEANHAGNAPSILETYPEATLVAGSGGSHQELHGITEDTEIVEDGDTIDLGTHTLTFHDPLFFDHAMTIWMTEETTDSLFTVDFLGFQHNEGECLRFTDELDYELTKNQLEKFNGYAFVWFRFIDPEKTDEAIDEIIEMDPSMVLPAHGQPTRRDIPSHLQKMKEVLRDISQLEQENSIDRHTHRMMMFTEDSSPASSD